jgi:hypothetical protein
MELFDHPVLYEKSVTGHQFFLKDWKLAPSSFENDGN